MTSARELLRQLDLLVLLADPLSRTLGPFLLEHQLVLPAVLGLTGHELLALATLPEEVLIFYLGPALRSFHASRREAQQNHKRELARGKIQRMVEQVRWAGSRAEFHAPLFLELLQHLPTPQVVLAAPHFEIGLSSARLKKAALVLRHQPDLRVFADHEGLHFRWRQGQGHLRLLHQPPRSREALQVIQLAGQEPSALQAAQ